MQLLVNKIVNIKINPKILNSLSIDIILKNEVTET